MKQPDSVMLSYPLGVEIKKCWRTFLSTTAVRYRNKNGYAAELVYQTLLPITDSTENFVAARNSTIPTLHLNYTAEG